MKFSIAVSILILAIGGALGLMHQKRLANLGADHRELVGQAEKLGISVGDTASPEETRVTKRQRDDHANKSGSLASEFVAFAKEMQLHSKDGGKADEEFEKRSAEMMKRLMELDGPQLKEVISGLRNDPGLSDEMRRNMIGFSIMMLAEDHPSSALALFKESSDLLGDSQMGRQVIGTSLTRWAKEDPMAAIAWLRENEKAHPDASDDVEKTSILAGAAEKDPKLAFKILGEIQLDDNSAAIQTIVESGKTPEQRTAILNALREHLKALPEGEERDDMLQESLESMGRNISDESFDAVRSWIDSAKLSPEETGQFAAGLSYFNTKEDTGRWIDWMAKNLPKEEVEENVDNLIGQWTQQDYVAAGKWLSASPEGTAKNAAISTYAGTVAEYEPQTAVQWAMMLPAGEARQSTLEIIYHNWPKSDAQAAADFAKEHGIDPEEDEATEEP
ncbi:MAG: hypothetical protein V4584_18775 [Verrucomicrobiota bacterium]